MMPQRPGAELPRGAGSGGHVGTDAQEAAVPRTPLPAQARPASLARPGQGVSLEGWSVCELALHTGVSRECFFYT